ncbi:MAG: single-stranded DNA-binding protein [Caulobacterales bacterium]
MFRFTLTGRIGRIEQVKGTPAIVRISLAADRLVDGPKDCSRGAWTKTEWVSAVSFDEALNRELLAALEVGQSVTLDGRIEPRKRQVGETTITDHSFILMAFQRLSKPAQPSASKAAAKAA